MKKSILNALIGLMAMVAVLLMLADSESLSLLVLSKVAGCSLFYLCSRVYDKVNPEEEAI